MKGGGDVYNQYKKLYFKRVFLEGIVISLVLFLYVDVYIKIFSIYNMYLCNIIYIYKFYFMCYYNIYLYIYM